MMKPKKATAPSDSHTSVPLSVALSDNRTGQRDSQDLRNKSIKVVWDAERFEAFLKEVEDKSFQAGFQEAVESIMEMGEIALKESDNQQDFMIRFFDRLRNMSDLSSLVKVEGKDEK